MASGRSIFRKLVATVIVAAAALAMAQVSMALLSPTPAEAQYKQLPPETGPSVTTNAPEIADRAGSAIPLDLEFTRSDGKTVNLADLYNRKRPVILSLVYFSCTSLCIYTQDDLARIVRTGPRSLSLGKDFDVVVVSIDPKDTTQQAAQKRDSYLKMMDRPAGEPGLTYLTGKEESIKKLADAVGFSFKENFNLAPDDVAGKFAHSTGIFVTTSTGKISQTIKGVGYTSDTLHNAILVAADGKIGTGLLGVGLSCGAMKFNPLTGQYQSNPWFWAGTAGGMASIGFMAIFLGMLWRSEFKRKKGGTGASGAGGIAQDGGPRVTALG